MPFGRKRKSWKETAMILARNIAECRSEDPYKQVGAVIVKHDKSLILGYNGAPSDIDIDWSNRDERRKRVIHAEANALSLIQKHEGILIAVTALPCVDCLKLIAQKKIPCVIYGEELLGYDNDFTKQLANEFGITLEKLTI